MTLVAFFLSLLFFFLQGVQWAYPAIYTMGPWMVYLAFNPCKTLSFLQRMWLILLVGIGLDLLSDHPSGFHALIYPLSFFCLYSLRSLFFYENPFHLLIGVAFLSFITTLGQQFFLFLFDRRVPFSGQWGWSDYLGMPIVDTLYALIWFVWPLWLLNKGICLWKVFRTPKRRSSQT